MARSREQAMEESLSFQPHLLVLNIGLPENEALNLVDWLRERDSLTRLFSGATRGADFSQPERSSSAMESDSVFEAGTRAAGASWSAGA